MPPPVPESHYDLLRDAIFDNDADRFAELLTVEGLDVDHFDAGGQTMLHLASFWGRMPLVKILLNAGASLKTKNAAGCTALDLATHWGHSSVAEIIRLRGGRSVWEEKMGQLQIRVEDLKLQNAQVLQQYQSKKEEHDALLDEFHGLHKRYEEEKSAHLVTKNQLTETQQLRDALETEKSTLIVALGEMTEQYRTTAVEKARSDALQEQAHRELQAALAHRDEVLASMEQSVAKQQQITERWQQAEAAAAIADSQRNFTLAEKEKLHKQHTATLGDLVIATERLHAAEQELMTLRVELAEYIYGKEKDQRVLRRAARVLARTGGITTADSAIRPFTTPASISQALQTAVQSAPPVDPAEPVLNARKRAQFSKAAQEYGQKVRQKELKKSIGRDRRHQVLENQYLTEGLSTPIVASDKFQEAFVSSLNAFATRRDDKWVALDQERERQLSYANNTMGRRAISTAPVPTRRRDSVSRGLGAMPVGLTKPEDGAERVVAPRNLAPLRRKKSILEAEPIPNELDDRPGTSQSELRMRIAFFDER